MFIVIIIYCYTAICGAYHGAGRGIGIEAPEKIPRLTKMTMEKSQAIPIKIRVERETNFYINGFSRSFYCCH